MLCFNGEHKKLDIKLKANRPHPRDYPQTPTGYRHTDNHLGLVMVVVTRCCTRQSRERCRTDGRYQMHYLPASLSYAVDKHKSEHPMNITPEHP